jgi:hypothetical protein
MLKIKDNVDLKELEKLKYDDFNEQYDYEYSSEIIISIDKYLRTLTTYFYDVGEMVELDCERDTTIEDLKEYAPFLIDLVEKVEE